MSLAATQRLSANALSRPDQFPPEFISWLRQLIVDNSFNKSDGSGIQFGKSPQVGSFLEITTTGVGPSGAGQNQVDTSLGGIARTVSGANNHGFSDAVNGAGNFGYSITIRDNANGGISRSIQGTSNSGFVDSVSGVGNAGFVRTIADDNNSGMSDVVNGLNNLGSKLTIGSNFNTGRQIRITGTSNSGYLLVVSGTSNGGIQIGTDGAGSGVQIGNTGDLVGFYGVGAVVRASHPTTLSQVITILTNLGLCN